MVARRRSYSTKSFKYYKKEYELAGFLPLETASVEKNDILLAKGGINTKEIYTLGKLNNENEKKSISLRFDQTVPLARYTAQNYGKLIFPFKRYQIQKVFRGERPGEGRFREFYQADIDVIGDNELSNSYDAEIISIINRIFTNLNIGKFKIKINNRKLKKGLMEELNISKEKEQEIFRILDKLDKLSKEDILNILKNEISEEDALKLLDFALSKELNENYSRNETYQQGIKEINTLLEEVYLFGVDKNNIAIDLSIARGLDYYTGTIYETFLEELPELGSICSGGRYDDLASTYTKQKLPGVGISIGLSRLVDAIIKNSLIKIPSQKNAKYLVFTNEDKEKMLKVATKLREEGNQTEISFLSSYKKEMKYAQKKGYQYIVISGDNNKYIVRDLSFKDRDKSDKEYMI